jgi:Anti-sigma-K factor rskA
MTQARSDAEQELVAGYVLGDLSAEELAQFEQLLQQHPELLAEVNAMQVSFQLVPQALPKVTPPPALLEKMMAAHAAMAVASEPVLPRSFPWSKLIAAWAVLAALLLGSDNLWLRRQLSLAQQTPIDRVGTILQQPNSRLVTLKGEAGSTAAGTLLFTPGQWQEVIVSLGNLPPLPPDQVYRMWLTLKNDETLLCGEFNTNPQGAVFIHLNPPKTPPKGVKATGIFVTVDSIAAPPAATGQRVMTGAI